MGVDFLTQNFGPFIVALLAAFINRKLAKADERIEEMQREQDQHNIRLAILETKVNQGK